jgi:hypothetical protein
MARLWRDQGKRDEARELLAAVLWLVHRRLRHARFEGGQDVAGRVARLTASFEIYLVKILQAGRTVTARRRPAFLSRALWVTAQRVGTAPGVRWSVENILPGAGIAVALLALAAMAGEFALRVKTPFLANNWPIKFDGSYGFNFVPGAKVELTNHLDFWAENIVNSLGFLDREPPSTEYPGTGVCRIAFFGDSMIEAAQVPLEQKVQIQLERFANESHGGKKFQTLAFGFSGTGQANQIPFYDVFAKRFHPNVVVLVFVSNDFANNSSVLESIRNGWDPFHPPRLFFDRDATGGFQSIPY